MTFMETIMPRLSLIAIIALTGLYVVFFGAGSFLDLWTTALALHRPEVAEGNPFAVVNGSYSAWHAWTFTAIVAPFLLAYVIYGLANLQALPDRTLERPLRSYADFGNPVSMICLLIFYVIPKSDRAALHTLSAAISFAILRYLAAINNAMIAAFGDGPLAALIRIVWAQVGQLWAFVIVLGLIYTALTLATAVMVAGATRNWRRTRDTPHAA